jgi:hypothetical protein
MPVMLTRHLNWFSLALLVTLAPAPTTASNAITGQPRIIDGDTIEVAGERIRLHGIDAPESKQTCEWPGKTIPCGRLATLALMDLTAGAKITCKTREKDRYGRWVPCPPLFSAPGSGRRAYDICHFWAGHSLDPRPLVLGSGGRHDIEHRSGGAGIFLSRVGGGFPKPVEVVS